MARWSRYNVLVEGGTVAGLLVFNTRTGAMVSLNANRRSQVENPDEITPDFREFLLQQGFLVGDDVDELQLIIDIHEAARRDTELFSVTIELTEACNFRCLYCYQDHTASHMSDQVVEKVLNYLSNKMQGLRHLHVNWFGGEPLVRLDVLYRFSRQIAERAEALGCRLSQFITTNGSLITPAVAEELAGLGIENVQITLDGDEEVHDRLRVHASGRGTYRQVLAGCGHVVAAGLKLLVRVNVNRWNADRIEGLLDDLVAAGISPANTVIHATRTVDHGNCCAVMAGAIFNTRQFAEAWVKILKAVSRRGFSLPSLSPIAYNCPFDLQQTVMIGCEGSLRHCSSSAGWLADLTESGVEVNHTPVYHSVKERRPTDDPECKGCLYLPMCMGGCSYLQEIHQEKCNPERYITPELVLLTAAQANGPPTGE